MSLHMNFKVISCEKLLKNMKKIIVKIITVLKHQIIIKIPYKR